VFPVLHGPWGEDGTVQGLCETVGVPYVGADVAASAVGMDKAMFHVIATAAGIPRVETLIVMHREWLDDAAGVRERVAREIGYPAFAKPARLGSSFGISPVPDDDALGPALQLAFAHDDKALVERRAMGREVEVGLLGNDDPHASPLGEILHDSDWYDHDAKYREGGMRLEVPADVPAHVQDHARHLAVRAWSAIGCSGLARVDFFLEGEDLYVSEINTIPGFTSTSVWGRLMAGDGFEYPELVQRIIDLALERHDARRAYRG
jgi:D-alanine-D-alanine ligase